MNFSNTSEAQFTDMGPGDNLSPSNILFPPKLRPTTDKLLWLEAVLEWAETLEACANGGDSRAKGAAATLGLTLYRSLEFAKKEIVKKAVRTGEVRLTAKSEDETLDQMTVVKKVVDLVAKDSTVDCLRRIVGLYKEINSCKRRSGESINEFINRFARPALSYLNLTNSEQDSSDSQNFAIILLLNSSLSAQTFNNIISNLRVSTKMRVASKAAVIPISKDRVENVINILNTMSSRELNEDEKKMNTECLSVMKAATFKQNKSFDDHDYSSWIVLQDARRALEEAGLEESDLNDLSSAERKPDSSTRSYLNSNKYEKRNRRRKYNQDKEWTSISKENKEPDVGNGNGEASQKSYQERATRKGRYDEKSKANGTYESYEQSEPNGSSKPFFQ